MPIHHLAFILVCSVSFASMDFLRKVLAGSMASMVLVFYLAVGALPVMLAWMLVEGGGQVAPGYYLPGLSSVVLNVIANFGFVHSVRRSPLSRTVPYLSLTPVFTSLLAIPILHEVPSGEQAMGIVLVVCGAVALNLDRARGVAPGALFKALTREKGSLLMMGVALLWSLAAALDKKAIFLSSLPFHGTVLSVGVATGALLYLFGRGRGGDLGSFRRAPKATLALMGCACLALAFQLLSIQVVLVSLVETFKRAIGCFMAVVLGRMAFGEAVTWHKLLAITAMVAGVALVLGVLD